MAVVVDVLVLMVVIARKQLTALELVATPNQNLDTPVLVYHDMSEGMIVVLTTSLKCCQRRSDVVVQIHPPLWQVTQHSLGPVQAMYSFVANFSSGQRVWKVRKLEPDEHASCSWMK